MADKKKYGNTSIGTDPSLLEKVDVLDIKNIPKAKIEPEKTVVQNSTNEEIETLDLDFMPQSNPNLEKNNNDDTNNKKEKKPSKKKNLSLKAILFAVLIIVLIAGVGFGLFFYLRLGTNHARNNGTSVNNNTVSENNDPNSESDDIKLKNVIMFTNDKISDSISDYVTFNKLNNVSCILNTDNIDNTKMGNYNYAVTCNNKKYTGHVSVVDKTALQYSTYAVYKTSESDIDVKEFAISSKAEFEIGDIEFKNKIEMVSIKEKLGDDITFPIKGMLVNVQSEPSLYLSCQKKEGNYIVIDKFAFDKDKKDLKVALRMFEYTLADEKDYYSYVAKIDNGSLTLGDISGYALIDNYKKSITLVNELTYDELNEDYGSDFPEDFETINSYYRSKDGYECSI